MVTKSNFLILRYSPLHKGFIGFKVILRWEDSLQTAIEKSPHLRDEIDNEILFENLKEYEGFKRLNGNTQDI